ncbi:hypothetical protein ACFVZW_16550 [Streptomyces sp. NPDC059567]|uniref:hypothetical protein n=1 Tax=Streptomyces sp. NPDC059567 TaxID=3346867 RepID=UPI0036B781FB
MRSTPAIADMVARSTRRSGLALAVTTLAVLTLASCGTRTSGASGSPSRPADAVGARHTEAAAGSGQQAAFAAMLDEMARSCPTGAPSGPPVPAEAPTGAQSGPPVPSRAPGGRPLPSDDPATDALEGPIAPTAGRRWS